MSFDGLFTKAMTEEIASLLEGGRINKVHQPYKNEVILVVRAGGKNHKLLLSAHPSYSRVQMTEESYENPKEAPMFCMLLRKHLEGYTIENIYQYELDRMIIFEVKGRNELGDVSQKQLIIEIMGRHSNIVLVDKERNMILDSIKHVSHAVNSYRAILPGQEYKAPPAQEKNDPFKATEDDIRKNIDFNAGKLDRQLVAHFSGVSPLVAKEAVYRAGLANSTTLPTAFLKIIQEISEQKYAATIKQDGNKEVFYMLPLEHLSGNQRTFSSLSEMLDRYYFGKAERDRVKQKSQDVERFITNEIEKNSKKIGKLERTLKDTERGEQYQLFGELLTANLYQMKKGMKEIEVVNYYDEEQSMITIPLDPLKNPSDNAQKYFSRYQKSKNAVGVVQDQIEKTKLELAYFEALNQQLQSASPRDIEEIREELQEEGYIRQKKKKGMKKPANAKPQLETYYATDGDLIFVGKNNKQNDYLTNKFARRDEIWLHTKDIPGSHVVIRNESPSEKTIKEAAVLAAFFSKAKQSSSVPVDFTQVRHVKKPNGSKPGFVIYDQQQTVYITPDPDTVIRLKEAVKE
ncbi:MULTISPECIES: NFACT RNA binding domain-containing protein [unclassified Bacillus (in: firmicutes)]|uniref:Rqc2 family fibronectin-binding protein n=1 Tax=unclassified Bacillus (in: firmicutes) TaxID=185979 RepID=UPI001BEB4FD8|nr:MULTISPECIES: NFACT RNA binding domain-containing protein [unclassified Bacillus (in: firmicutes)]MBT2615596.1 NFACT family protein [Bacillus sp. ISL-78]MBT2628733.1 NFACT family protein [Bacillus sp. ISL-101]MBT2715186.1 NFACT family protein [Bacillus sp. ISL-57]